MKIKTKTIIMILSLMVLLTIGIHADTDGLMVFIPAKENINLDKYDGILFQQYLFEKPKIDIRYEKILSDFMLIEFRKVAEKSVEYVDKNLADVQKLKKVAKKKTHKVNVDDAVINEYGNKLLIKMKIELISDERHVISEEVDKFGDKKKSFEKKKVLEIKSNILLIDLRKRQVIRDFDFKKKLTEEKRTNDQFNFKFLFDGIMSKFLKKFLKKGNYEKRYLLTMMKNYQSDSVHNNSVKSRIS